MANSEWDLPDSRDILFFDGPFHAVDLPWRLDISDATGVNLLLSQRKNVDTATLSLPRCARLRHLGSFRRFDFFNSFVAGFLTTGSKKRQDGEEIE